MDTKKAKPSNKTQLAALSTLLGIMLTASNLSRELEELSASISGPLDALAERAGVSIDEVSAPLWDAQRPKRSKTAKRSRKSR